MLTQHKARPLATEPSGPDYSERFAQVAHVGIRNRVPSTSEQLAASVILRDYNEAHDILSSSYRLLDSCDWHCRRSTSAGLRKESNHQQRERAHIGWVVDLATGRL